MSKNQCDINAARNKMKRIKAQAGVCFCPHCEQRRIHGPYLRLVAMSQKVNGVLKPDAEGTVVIFKAVKHPEFSFGTTPAGGSKVH